MMADRADFSASLAQRHSQRQREMLPMARLLSGAAPVMDKLQRSEEFERYCTYLQGIVEQFRSKKDFALQKLTDPRVVNDEEIRKLRQDIFIADVTMDSLKFAIELPAYILQGREEADKFITEFQKKNEDAANKP